jgi:hypothetical protein
MPPNATRRNWLWTESEVKDELLERYERAREMQPEYLAHGLMEIADE